MRIGEKICIEEEEVYIYEDSLKLQLVWTPNMSRQKIISQKTVGAIQLDCLSVAQTGIINLPTNQKGYGTFETTVGKL